MKTSVWSSYYYDLSPEDTVLEFKAHGFNATELSDERSRELLKSRAARRVATIPIIETVLSSNRYAEPNALKNIGRGG